MDSVVVTLYLYSVRLSGVLGQKTQKTSIYVKSSFNLRLNYLDTMKVENRTSK